MNVISELAEYLDTRFDPKKLIWNDDRLRRELRAAGSADKFWAGQEALYLHAAASTDDWRVPFIKFVRENAPPPQQMLEYHAGIGNFAYQLGDGYDAAFVEPKSPCREFLEWRIKQRKSKAKVYDLKDDAPVHPLVIAFDAIHRYEPDAQWPFIQRLASLGERVIVNLDARNFVEKGYFWPVEAAALLARIAGDYQIVRHTIVNDVVNLAAFATPARMEEIEESING